MKKTSLKVFINDKCGGASAVANKTKLSARAIYKWAEKGSLPRTEFSGETSYSQDLSDLSGSSVDEIKEMFKPQPQPQPKGNQPCATNL